MKKIRLLIYDDNSDRRESLTMLLESYERFEVCASYSDCSNVLEEIQIHLPDVVLLDIQMPNVDGIRGVAIIKKNFPDIKVIMQTVFEDDEKVFQAIVNGATGYILKRTPSERIVDAIIDSMEGGSPMTPSIAAKVLDYFRQSNKVAENDYNLTEKEQEILKLLVDGLSYKMIADRQNISFHTVNSHIKKIYEKLQVHSMSEAVSKAIQEKIIKP
jgi:DNA-binding NarL/FixJ family response regulator